MCDGNFAFDALLVPAYCAGGLSVGAFVNRLTWHDPRSSNYCQVMSCKESGGDGRVQERDCCQSDRAKAPRSYSYSIGRYVQSESSGALLILKYTDSLYQKGVPATEIMYMQNGSSTRRTRTYFQCSSKPYSCEDVVNFAQSCVSYEECRFCPVCRSSPNENCSCQLPLVRTSSLFDFLSAAKCIETHTGEFMGTAEIIARGYCPAMDPHTSPRFNEMMNSISTDSDSVSDGYVSDYICATCISSVRNMSLTRRDRSNIHDTLTSALSSVAVHLSVSAGNPAKLTVPTGTDVSGTVADNASRMLVSERKSVCSAAPSSVQQQDQEDTFDKNSLQNSSTTPSGWKSTGETVQVFSSGDLVSSSPQDPLRSDEYEIQEVMRSPAHAKACGSSAVGLSSTGYVGSSTDVQYDKASLEDSDRGTESKGAGSCPSRRGHTSDVSSETRAARECQRMLKNRASAARANARKKAFMDELKQSIKTAKDRAAALNARQLELVRENMQLRRRLLGQQ